MSATLQTIASENKWIPYTMLYTLLFTKFTHIDKLTSNYIWQYRESLKKSFVIDLGTPLDGSIGHCSSTWQFWEGVWHFSFLTRSLGHHKLQQTRRKMRRGSDRDAMF